jgi:ferritin-like metal-binding protein YciE
LKDIYWAEKALTKAIPKMIKNARTPQLIEALTNHLRETENQVDRCQQVFESLGHKPTTKMCAAMEGLITESEDIMADCEEGPMRDAGIISACQKVEHYEIATYGTLRKIAETLGLNEAKRLLEKTLEEEKAADMKLTEIAVNVVNIRAREEDIH